MRQSWITHGARPRSSKAISSTAAERNVRADARRRPSRIRSDPGRRGVRRTPRATIGRRRARGGLEPDRPAHRVGQLAARRPELPSVVGSEGVGRTADGRRVYFGVQLGLARRARRRAGGRARRDPRRRRRRGGARLRDRGPGRVAGARQGARWPTGETVLVLGASGPVGAIAAQLARLRGAGRVIEASRRGDGHVDPAGPFDDGIDVVIDPLWGAPAEAAIRAMAFRGRLVQLGQSAGGEATLASADIRFKELEILGHTNFAAPPDARAAALRRMWAHHAAGELTVACETVPSPTPQGPGSARRPARASSSRSSLDRAARPPARLRDGQGRGRQDDGHRGAGARRPASAGRGCSSARSPSSVGARG